MRDLDAIAVSAETAARLFETSKRTWYRMHHDGLVPEPRIMQSLVRWDVAELKAWSAAGCPPRKVWNGRKDSNVS